MTGLMLIFMLISIIFMVQMESSNDKLHDVAQKYTDTKDSLYLDLLREFATDLPKWHATLDHDLTIRFQEPNVLFDTGKADLKDKFTAILDDFFPRYVKVIASDKYRSSISEIRIEGHTSSIWAAETDPDRAYFRNMELSQSRTRSTLEYVFLLPQVANRKAWLIKKLTANGLSSSQTLLNSDGSENIEQSQRVEFRIRTDAEAKIKEILRVAR